MHAEFQPAVYILASHRNGTLYTGVTSNLLGRITQHRDGTIRGFTSNYSIKRLVWFEAHAEMTSAIQREKRIKKWLRAWNIKLIEEANPNWRDLAVDFGFDMAASTRLITSSLNRHPRESGDPSPDTAIPDGFPLPRE